MNVFFPFVEMRFFFIFILSHFIRTFLFILSHLVQFTFFLWHVFQLALFKSVNRFYLESLFKYFVCYSLIYASITTPRNKWAQRKARRKSEKKTKWKKKHLFKSQHWNMLSTIHSSRIITSVIFRKCYWILYSQLLQNPYIKVQGWFFYFFFFLLHLSTRGTSKEYVFFKCLYVE